MAQWVRIRLQCTRLGFDTWVGKILWRTAWQPTLVFLPRESHGQKSLEGYSPQGHKESDTTEVTEHTGTRVNKCRVSHSVISNSLQPLGLQPGSSVHGILQARILVGEPFPSPEDLPDPGIEPRSPALPADSVLSEPPRKPKQP